MEGAAGAGRLDVVKGFFNADFTLKPLATEKQLRDGFAWACEFDRIEVVKFLLSTGMQASPALNRDGRETGLHWAAFEAHTNIVRLLLDHGAPVNVRDKRHDGTPLDWALYAWGTTADHPRRDSFYEIIQMLIKAGARIGPDWFKQRPAILKKVQSDPRMQAAMGRELKNFLIS